MCNCGKKEMKTITTSQAQQIASGRTTTVKAKPRRVVTASSSSTRSGSTSSD